LLDFLFRISVPSRRIAALFGVRHVVFPALAPFSDLGILYIRPFGDAYEAEDTQEPPPASTGGCNKQVSTSARDKLRPSFHFHTSTRFVSEQNSLCVCE
jgi:hypothetical protein